MSTNTWIPANNSSTAPVAPHLNLYINMVNAIDHENPVLELSADMITTLTSYMRQPASYWQQQAADLKNEDIISLIRFFALSEEKYSELFAGKLSPVIGLHQVLKLRKNPLPKEILMWLKKYSSNRFLPNGSIF